MSPRPNMLWTATENTTLLSAGGVRARSTPKQWQAIAEQLPGRSWMACRQQYFTLRRKAKGNLAPPRKQRARRTNGRIDNRPEMQQPPSPHTLPRHAFSARLRVRRPLAGTVGAGPEGGAAVSESKSNAVTMAKSISAVVCEHGNLYIRLHDA